MFQFLKYVESQISPIRQLISSHLSADNKTKVRVNLLYRSYTKGNPSQVIFTHGTRVFRRWYSHVKWMFLKLCWCFIPFRFKAKENLKRWENVFYLDLLHSRPQRPRSFWSAPRISTSGQVQRHSGFEWICKHNRLRREPIRFVRLDSEHAQSDGKSVNRGLPLLDSARGRDDSWCWPKGARPLGTRIDLLLEDI